MKGIASRVEEQFPQQQKGRSVRMQGLIDSVTGGSKLPLLLLLGAVGLVLLIASANVASIVLARTAARTRELSVRLALGAPKLRLIRQLFVESFVLVFASSVIGLGVAVICTRVLASLAALQIPFVGNVQFDLRIFGALFLLTSLTGLIFGLGSGLQGFRLNMLKGLKEGPTQVGLGRGLSRIYSLVVIAEVALSVFLLIGSGLLVRTFVELRAVKPGFESANVLTAQISLPKKEYANGVAMGHFYGLIQDKMQSLPGVHSAGLVSLLPMQDWGMNGSFGIQGRPTQETSTPPTAEIRIVSSDYFKTLGIPLKAGRPLSAQDQASSPHVLLVNETLQRKYFSGQSPIGQYLLLPEPWQIVGVVADVKQTRLDRETLAELYLPYTQLDEVPLLTDMTLVVKAQVPPLSLVGALRSAVTAVDKNQPIYNVSTMDDVVSNSVAGLRLYVSLATGFAVLALILAIAGIYGMISYTTTQRTREFGLRVAMGAQKRDLVFLVLAQQMAKVVLGIGVGVCASFVFVKILTSALFGVKATDPLTFCAVCLLVCTISFVASYLPARRASQVDAMSSLRYE
jgi:predicted permease